MIEISSRHELICSKQYWMLPGIAYMAFYKRLQLSDCNKFCMCANAVWLADPDGMQHRMKQLAALAGCEPGLRGLPAFGIQAGCGECFESTLRLQSENIRSAGCVRR